MFRPVSFKWKMRSIRNRVGSPKKQTGEKERRQRKQHLSIKKEPEEMLFKFGVGYAPSHSVDKTDVDIGLYFIRTISGGHTSHHCIGSVRLVSAMFQ